MRVVIVTMRYLGDCIVSAALAESVKKQFPDAEVWMLTYKKNTSILEGIESIDGILGFEDHPSYLKQIQDFRGIWKTFDWAFITHKSTRACLYGAIAGKRSVMHSTRLNLKTSWCRFAVTDFVDIPGALHKIDEVALLLKPLLGYVPAPEPIAPYAPLPKKYEERLFERPYVVFHLCSQYEDKNVAIETWKQIGERLIRSGFRIVFTGGGSKKETSEIKAVSSDWEVKDYLVVSGKLSFGATGALLRKANLYIGVDTATTHVAAATGCPTIALFGPTSVVRWGPACRNASRAYRNDLAVQRLGNVSVIRNKDFLQCHACRSRKEGRCSLSENPRLSKCLQTLAPETIWREVEYWLFNTNLGAKEERTIERSRETGRVN